MIIPHTWIQIYFFPPKEFPFHLCTFFWLHPHIDLNFDVSFEFLFFSHSCWCFLEVFQFVFWSYCYLILYLFNVGVFSWGVKVCSFELLCSFSSLIFQFMLEFFFKLTNDWNCCHPHFLKWQVLFPWVLIYLGFDFAPLTKVYNPTILLPHIFQVINVVPLSSNVMFWSNFSSHTKACNPTLLLPHIMLPLEF